MTDPLKDFSTLKTPQSEQARADQVQNDAGGYVFSVDDWARLERFLILGSAGGTYYVREREFTTDNAQVVVRCADLDGERLIRTIVDISQAGRAPKNDQAIFALAIAASASKKETRVAAWKALGQVCRISTHLFQFAEYVQNHRGWGAGLRAAVAHWYTDPPVEKVAYQAVKYRQRDTWTHSRMLRLSHPKHQTGARAALFDFIVGRENDQSFDELQILDGFRRIQAETDPAMGAKLVTDYKLPWEAVPDALLASPEVWEAIVDSGMPVGALIRNLARLTNLGVISPMSLRTDQIAGRITDADELKRGRIHPLQILDAHLTYAQGHGARGKSSWSPVTAIVDALDAGFYKAFGAIEPANKRTMLAIDISGSMTWSTIGKSAVLRPREAAAALALVTEATEPQTLVTAFAANRDRRMPGISEVAISSRQRLDDVTSKINGMVAGGTDCALPMVYAREKALEIDTFIILTDNESWAGPIHVHQALDQYRKASGINARAIAVGMTATDYTVLDPDDSLSLNVVGFDTAAPNVMSAFSRGDF